MAKMGDQIAQYAIKMQQQEDDNNVVRQENELRAYMNQVLYDPQKGLAVQKGHNAKGSTAKFDEVVDKTMTDVMKNMVSDNMKAKLYERTSNWLGQHRNTISRNEGEEIKNAMLQDINTGYSNAAEAAMQVPGATSFDTLLMQAQTYKADLMHFAGYSSDTADQALQEKVSNTYVSMAENLYDAGDTQGLMDLYESAHGKVTVDAEVKVSKLNSNIKTQMAGEQTAGKYANDPQYKNPDGTLNVAKITEAIENEVGPNATKRVKKWIGGGKGGYSGNASVDTMINNAASENGVDPLLVAAIAFVESGYNQGAKSPAGAIGTMQLMPTTAAELGINPDDQADNINGGAKYIKQMLDYFGGDVEKAIAAYNAGPQAVKDYDGIPPYKETQDYVKKVQAAYDELKTKGTKAITPRSMPTQGSDIDQQVQQLSGNWQNVIPEIGGVLHDKFGIDGVISSGARSAEHNAEVGGATNSYHIDNGGGGNALDVVLPAGTSQTKAEEVLKYFKDSGAFEEVLFHDAGSGYHLHLGGLKGNLDNAVGQGHWEETEVSAYNEKVYKAAMAAATKKANEAKSAHDTQLQNAVEAIIPNVSGMSSLEEIKNYVRGQYPNMTEIDVDNVTKAVYSTTLAEKRQDESYRRQQKAWAKQDAAEAFDTWRVAHPDASVADMLAKAQELGVDPKVQASIQASIGVGNGLDKAYAWGKNSDNTRTFNDVCKDFKLTGIEKSNVREKLNAESKRRMQAGEPPLDMSEIRAFVQDEASTTTINKKGFWGGTDIKTADIPYGWTRTDYGVLDPNGNTMEFDEETQEWTVMNSD